MEKYSHYKEWLFGKILEKVNAYKRIHPLDIRFVKYSLNKKFEKLTKNGWLGKPFSILEGKLKDRAELLVNKFEEIDKHINEEIDNQLSHLTKIQLN